MTDRNEAPSISEKLRGWLHRAVCEGASDLHLIVGYPPVLRLHGDLTEMPEPPLEGEETHALLCSLCAPEMLARLHEQKNIDFSFEVGLNGERQRFRANMFYSGGQLGACLRVVP